MSSKYFIPGEVSPIAVRTIEVIIVTQETMVVTTKTTATHKKVDTTEVITRTITTMKFMEISEKTTGVKPNVMYIPKILSSEFLTQEIKKYSST